MVKGSEEVLTSDHHGCFKGKACNVEEKVVELVNNTKKVGKDDPRRIVHSLKLGLAATMVSSFYYFEPLYDSFGASSIWAIITVIVVFEFSVGKLAYNAHSCSIFILLRVLVQRTMKASQGILVVFYDSSSLPLPFSSLNCFPIIFSSDSFVFFLYSRTLLKGGGKKG